MSGVKQGIRSPTMTTLLQIVGLMGMHASPEDMARSRSNGQLLRVLVEAVVKRWHAQPERSRVRSPTMMAKQFARPREVAGIRSAYKMIIMGHQILFCHVPVVRSFFIL